MTAEDTVRPARQCTLPDCTREAVDPSRRGGLCPDHNPHTTPDEPEHPDPSSPTDQHATESQQSPAETHADRSSTHETKPTGSSGDTPSDDHETWAPVEATNPDREHANPIDAADVTDAERAALLCEYLDAYVDTFGVVPRLMPLDDAGKAPIIKGRCRLDSPEARSLLVDGEEAIRQIRDDGARGFALYAGNPDHNTADVVLVDVDDRDTFPYEAFPPTLTVLSGSGRGEHGTFRNGGDIQNAKGTGEVDGEIRADNWYCVTPGSIHPSGGVYHVAAAHDIATLTTADLPDALCPGTRRRNQERTAPRDATGDGEVPDDDRIRTRLDAAFANPADGDRIKAVYDGNYSRAGFDDRSSAEFWLANRLDSWVGGGNRRIVERVLDRANLQKWPERTDRSYRDSVLDRVGYQKWYYEPDETEEATPDVSRPPRPAYGPDAAAFLPDTPRQQAIANGWDWHTADRPDTSLTVDAARKETTAAISDAITHATNTLIDALPTMGKSHGSVKAAAETGRPVTILTVRGNEEQYAQFREWAAEYDLRSYTLPAFHRDCPCANGTHGEQWTDRVHAWRNAGATPQQIHTRAAHVLDRPLPCQTEGKCPYTSKWQFEPEEYDVLLGHPAHAHQPKVTTGRTVIFDEFAVDAFETTFDEQLEPAVSRFCATHDGFPFDDYADVMANRDALQRRADALTWFIDHGVEPAPDQVLTREHDEQGHARAPLATFTLLAAAATDLGNGFERVNLPDGGVGVYHREANRVWLLEPPELTYTRNVIALDGTPTPDLWELGLGCRLRTRQILDDDERRTYISEALSHQYIRTTDAVKPYNTADNVAVAQEAALLEEITAHHDKQPDLITTSTALAEYDTADGVNLDALVDTTGYYGNLLGSNAFRTSRVGCVIGSTHYGDDFVKKWGAYAGEAVARVDDSTDGKGNALSYGSFGDRVLQHMREHTTLQAVMRFGRDGNGAIVYVHTNTLPEWVPIAGNGHVVQTWSDGVHQVRTALDDFDLTTPAGAPSVADIAAHDTVDVGERQVLSILTTLHDQGVLARHPDPADGRRDVWCDDGLHRLSDHGNVDLPSLTPDNLTTDEVHELARSSTYTWKFVNRPNEESTADQPSPQSTPSQQPATVAGPDPPPDDPE